MTAVAFDRDDDGHPLIPRDHFDRPKIITPDGKIRAYTRTSKMAKTLSEEGGLSQWKLQTAFLGLARRPDLHGQLLELGPRGQHQLSLFNTLIEEAREAGGGNDASRWGTTFHDLAEWFDAYDYLFPADSNIPADLMGALDAYVELTKSIEMIACEGFVVQDDVQCAGSFDRIGILPDSRLVIGDIKTAPDFHTNKGKIAEGAMQLATYSRSVFYHPDGTRTTFAEALGAEVDTSVGVIIQVSRKREPGKDGLIDRLIPVDLNAGWRNVQRALDVRANRLQPPIQIGLDTPPQACPF